MEVKGEEEFWGREAVLGVIVHLAFLLVRGIRQANGEKQMEVI